MLNNQDLFQIPGSPGPRGLDRDQPGAGAHPAVDDSQRRQLSHTVLGKLGHLEGVILCETVQLNNKHS